VGEDNVRKEESMEGYL